CSLTGCRCDCIKRTSGTKPLAAPLAMARAAITENNAVNMPHLPVGLRTFTSSRPNAAVDPLIRQVRRLVVHPEPPPLALDLPQILRLVQEHVGPVVGIVRIL